MGEEVTLHHDRSEDELQRRRLIALMRVVFGVVLAIVLALAIVNESTENRLGIQVEKNWWMFAAGALMFFAIVILIDVLTPKRKLSTITAIIFGMFAGLIATLLLGLVVDYLKQTYFPAADARPVTAIKVILGLGLCYLGAATVLQTQDDFRLVIPYVEFAKQIRGPRPLLLDTSALIDGRIADIAEVGLFQTPLVVPQFVIDELQMLGDSSDRMKRARGRRGLDVVTRLQRSPRLDFTRDETVVPGKDVDQMLVELARLMPATIVTTDIGLNRVASIQGVTVLNINDLANAMKPNVIPGEPLTVHLIKRGEQPGQAVGYLDDGTMVVAENGEPAIGNEVSLVVRSTMQTSAGRLIFGRIPDEGGEGQASSTDGSAREVAGDMPGPGGDARSAGAPAGSPERSKGGQGRMPRNPRR